MGHGAHIALIECGRGRHGVAVRDERPAPPWHLDDGHHLGEPLARGRPALSRHLPGLASAAAGSRREAATTRSGSAPPEQPTPPTTAAKTRGATGRWPRQPRQPAERPPPCMPKRRQEQVSRGNGSSAPRRPGPWQDTTRPPDGRPPPEAVARRRWPAGRHNRPRTTEGPPRRAADVRCTTTRPGSPARNGLRSSVAISPSRARTGVAISAGPRVPAAPEPRRALASAPAPHPGRAPPVGAPTRRTRAPAPSAKEEHSHQRSRRRRGTHPGEAPRGEATGSPSP